MVNKYIKNINISLIITTRKRNLLRKNRQKNMINLSLLFLAEKWILF